MQGPLGACPACGGAVGATARFCGSCGRPMAVPPAASPAARSSGSKGRAIAGIAAVVIVAIGVGAGLLLLRPGPGGPGGPGSSGGPSGVPAASNAASFPSGSDEGDSGPSSSPSLGSPGTALATPPIVNGHADESALLPPILEEGDVPPAEDPTTPVAGHLTLGPVRVYAPARSTARTARGTPFRDMPVAGISKVVDMPVSRMDAEEELRLVRSAEREAA